MDLRRHLHGKTEQELRNFAFKLNVRMTPRADLVTRLEVASRDLTRDRIRQVMGRQGCFFL